MSTKIHTLCDALGNPIAFHLTSGEDHDLNGFDALFPQIVAQALLADKAYDADKRVVDRLKEKQIAVIIPSKRNRRTTRDYDKELYKDRHLIENFFSKLKQYRAIATRYDKTKRNFLGAIYLAAAVVWLH